MILSNHQLTPDHFIALESLLQRCQRADGYTLPIYYNLLSQHRHLPCNVLYFHKQRLVGFLSVFFFYDDACELIVMVDPRYRKRHIASQMIANILPVIQLRGVARVICPSAMRANRDWLSASGFIYQNSELRMQWQSQAHLTESAMPDDVHFSVADDAHMIPDLVAMDVACFHSIYAEVEPTYQRLLGDPSYTLILIAKQGNIIGKAHLHAEPRNVVISDIAILPAYQGQGYGQLLVKHCILHVTSTTHLPLVLDVEADNANAVHIYKKLGFHLVNQYERWSNSVQWFCRTFIA